MKPEALAQHPVFRYPFNKGTVHRLCGHHSLAHDSSLSLSLQIAAQETERKEHYEKLYRRTKAQIEEEEMLIEEMKKIEKAQKKLQADRQKVAKLTQSIIAMPGTEPLPPPLEPPTVPLPFHLRPCLHKTCIRAALTPSVRCATLFTETKEEIDNE